MLNHRNIQILFLLLLVLMIFADWKSGFAFYLYFVLIVAYLTITFYGSSVIQANYFVRSVCRGNSDTKAIAITFDDGPLAAYTKQVLDILKDQKAPAAFFVIGKNIEGNEVLLKRMDDEGHLVGNHSYSHNFWFSMKSAGDMLVDMKRCDAEIKRATGKQVLLFRPPYGVTNPMVAKAIKLGGYTSIGWSLRTFDTVAKDKEQLLQKALKNLNNGDVVLFHEGSKYTADILSDYIREVRLRGFEIIRVDKLLGVKAYNLV